MNRRSLIGGLSATAAGALLFYVQPAEEQIAALEEDVQDLDERVSALETQAADDGASPSTPEGAENTGETGASSAESITVEGVGTTVTDKFSLRAGQYRVNATIPDPSSDTVYFILHVHDPEGNEEFLFNEIADHEGGPWEGSAVYRAPVDGKYFVSVENIDTEWSVTFEPF